MPLGQKLIPFGLNIDVSPQYLATDKAFFLKGIENGWFGGGQNSVEMKPAESNFLYTSVALPAGDNSTIGYYYHAEENIGYVVVYNSNGFHFIYRIKLNQDSYEIVYNFCKGVKGITNKPKDFFSRGRIALKSIKKIFPDGTEELYKELLLVNKKIDNIRIVVEDSIKTNSFTSSFFKENKCEGCGSIIKVGVPTPMAKIEIKDMPLGIGDKPSDSLMFGMFQFRFVDENAWGQRSEHGLISEQYFSQLSGCITDTSFQSGCVWLETSAPSSEIVKRTVEFRNCQLKNPAIGTDGNLFSEWKEAFSINLYDQTNENLKWYERIYDLKNKEFQLFDDGKKIRIKFCNNRKCTPITLSDIRDQNPAPFNSGTVAMIGNELVYGDNENNLPKIPKQDLENIGFSIEPTTASCELKFSRVKVYAVVHNYSDGNNQNNPIHTRQNTIGFGGYGAHVGQYEDNVFNSEKNLTEKGGYGQFFPEGVKGFRASLAGTDYTAESVQYLWTEQDFVEVGVLDESQADAALSSLKKGILVQVFDFGEVACGNYFFRIHAHNLTHSRPLNETSTYYKETTTWSLYKATRNPNFANNTKEIYINTSAGNDYDSLLDEKVAVIQDLTHPGWNAFNVYGYLSEDFEGKQPIEGIEVHKTTDADFVVGTSDHNGFYWWERRYGTDYRLVLKGNVKCFPGQLLAKTGIKKEKGTSFAGELYAKSVNPSYVTDKCNRFIISGRVVNCDTKAGVKGVAAVLSNTRPVFTNDKGEFKVIAHYSHLRENDKLLLSTTGNCTIVDCNCGPVNVVLPIKQPSCVSCFESVIDVGSFSMKAIVLKGFPKGSKIQIGISGHDWLGRKTAIQTNENMFVTFPTDQQTGNNSYQLLRVTLPSSFSPEFCKNYKRITFSFSKNTNYEDFLTWAADKVEFIDASDNINKTNPTKVKIWYRSLNEYNLLNGFNTNTTWSIQDSKGNSTLGDKVEFIKNIDGVYFPGNVVGNVKYNKEGSYFIVDYDDSFKNLKDGVLFKFKRQYSCEVNKTFYEFGLPINFCNNKCTPMDDNGEVIKSFILNGYSSYAVTRKIPVVTDVITLVTNQDGTVTKKVDIVKNTKLYPYLFEHHSPSDTWGDHCNNGGRVSYENPYEGKKSDRTQILVTGSLNQANDGAINYLHYFSLEDEFVINEQGWGAIIAILVRNDGQLLVICELSCFSLKYNDNRVIVDQAGYVVVPTNKRFSRPEINPSFEYGCQPDDINTISQNGSIVCFLDSQRQVFVLHDFLKATPISDGISSWLTSNIQIIKASNNAIYWHTGFDMRINKVFLTKFSKQYGYVNNEIDYAKEASETMAFNYVEKLWSMVHYTPELFGAANGDRHDLQFLSFKDALPWAQHNVVNPSQIFLNYFGVQCKPVIGVVTNTSSEDKSFLSTEVYCRQILFIIEKLETSTGQKSQLLQGDPLLEESLPNWEFGEGVSYAAYLCDTESIDSCMDVKDALYDGNPLQGKWLKALYIPNEPYKGEFFILTQIMSYFFNR